MEFKLNTKELDKALSQLFPILPTRTPLEILTHFLITVKDNLLTIFVSDSKVAYQKTIPVFANGEISAAVPGKLFHDTISSLPDTDLKIEFLEESKKCVIHTDTGKYVIGYVLPYEYPRFPVIEGKHTFKINGERLKNALHLTQFACAKEEEQRASMQGVLLDLKKDKLVFVSTDGHRLVKLTLEDFQSDIEEQLVLPSKSAEYLIKILDEKDVVVTIGDKLLKFEADGGVFMTRLVDDPYPNYESVIPLDNESEMKINRAEFLKTLRRASYYIHSRIKRIDFEITKDMLSITAENPELGTKMDEKILCEYNNEPLKIAFKHDFVTEAIEHMDSEEVVFKFNTPTRPCIIEPPEQKENENLIILIMPMRVNIGS